MGGKPRVRAEQVQPDVQPFASSKRLPEKDARVRSLKRRLQILESVRNELVGDIERAEKGLPLLTMLDDTFALRSLQDPEMPLNATRLRRQLWFHDRRIKARKSLRDAIRQLDPGSFHYGLVEALRILVMTSPDDKPRKLRDEFLLSAFERGLPKTDVQEAAEIRDVNALDGAFKRARKARRAQANSK